MTVTQSDPDMQMNTIKLLLDSKYWILFKEERRDLFDEFAEAVQENNIEVLFSFGNFIDLIDRSEQDELSEMISSIVSTYIPPQEYTGNDYIFSSTPISLVPDEEVQARAIEHTEDFEEMKTLRFLFRIGDWELLQEYEEKYKEAINYLRSVEREYGEAYITALLSDIESGVEQFSYDDMGDTKAIFNVVQSKRIGKYESKEKIDLNDIADLEIITHAIIANCDILLIESKWQRDNVQLVESVLNEFNSNIDLEVTDDMDEFVSYLKKTH